MDKLARSFVTPEAYEQLKERRLYSDRGWLLFVPLRGAVDLTHKVKQEFEKLLSEHSEKYKNLEVSVDWGEDDKGTPTRMFPDGEIIVRLSQHVSGSDAYVFQCVHNKQIPFSVNDMLIELLIAGRTLKVQGARHITAVVPYLPYSRGDKPTYMKPECTTARLMADMMANSGFDAVICYHPHTENLRGYYEPLIFIPINGLDLAISLFIAYKGNPEVVALSTDIGSGHITQHFAEGLGIDYVVTHKIRRADGSISSKGVLGDLEGKKKALIVEDESMSMSTIKNCLKILSKYDITAELLVSHLKLSEDYIEKLSELHNSYNLEHLYTTDDVPLPEAVKDLPYVTVLSLAERLAFVINHMFYGVSISAPFWPRTEPPMFEPRPI